jgi:DNA ligase-1
MKHKHSDELFYEDMMELVINLQTSNSTNDKIECLEPVKYNPELMSLLHYMYNPFFQYYVSWKNIKKRSDLTREYSGDIFTLLDMLKDRNITGHDAIGCVNGYLSCLPKEYHWLVELIFERSLKARVDTKLINRVMPGLIPTFNVALAAKYEDHAHKIDWDADDWYWSRKLDGVRAVCMIIDGDIKFYSRQGKEFFTLDKIKEAIKAHPMFEQNMVLDGELCIVDENGDENFTSVIKEIRRKDHTIENPVFKVFDCLTPEEFDTQVGTRKLSKRMYELHDLLTDNKLHEDSIFPIICTAQNKVGSEEEVRDLLEFADESGWEGIMIRKDVGYKGKRSNDLLKVKKMHDDEYIVEDVEFGPFRVIDSETGLETTIQTMTNVIIEHKGNVVSVGSGFSLDQRDRYFNYPEKIIGKEITVQYFEESQDKTGKHSLRFPVCKAVFEDGHRMV